jgi:hypothetical protein
MLTRVYTRALALDANNLYAGGQMSFSNRIPAALAPGEATIVSQ